MAGEIDEQRALQAARTFPGLAGMDLAKVVSCPQSYYWTEGEWTLDSGFNTPDHTDYRVAAFDFGIKRTILRKLAQRGCKVTVFPAQTPAEEILAMQPDGVFLVSLDELAALRLELLNILAKYGRCFP